VAGGWVLGRPEFLREVARHVRRRVTPVARGRPRRTPETASSARTRKSQKRYVPI
jgi:hypothetical protein